MIAVDRHSPDISTKCRICLSDDAVEHVGGAMVKTACQPVAHLFHLNCISHWLSQSLDSRRCAVCRQSALPLVRLLGGRIYEQSPYCESLPMQACRTGDLDTLKKLLQLDPSLITQEYPGCHPTERLDLLSITADNGETACMQALIDAGANPDSVRKSDGAAPLHIAAKAGQLANLTLLLERGAKINAIRTSDGITPAHAASEAGQTDCLKALINKGANINACTPDGITPLFAAVEGGHLDCLKTLIAHGADVNAMAASNGATPLYMAVWLSRSDCLQELIKHGAIIDTMLTNDRSTPLVAAAHAGDLECLKILIRGLEEDTACYP